MLRSKVRRKQHLKGSPVVPGPGNVKVGMVKGKADEDEINKALWNEFGTRGGAAGGGWGGPIPERPFMRNAMRENKDKYRKQMREFAKRITRGEMTRDQALDQLGIIAQGDVLKSIKSLSDPPNSALTIELKGSANPLVDTGAMRDAVTYKVDK